MMKDQSASVKVAIHKLQLFLLDACQSEDQLFTAGSLISRDDYYDVVTERSISNICGYPLCLKLLQPNRLYKGRYRISLKEHKVYDRNETHMYCSDTCLINSRAFGDTLQEERCLVVDPSKFNHILRLVEEFQSGSEDLKEEEDLDLCRLTIREKHGTKVGEMELESMEGPYNAIEGYVPLSNHSHRHLSADGKAVDRSESKARVGNTNKELFSDMDFMSSVIMSNEYCISKSPGKDLKAASKERREKGKKGSRAKLLSSLKHDSGSMSSTVERDTTNVVMDKDSDVKTSSFLVKHSRTPVDYANDRNITSEDAEPSLKPSLKAPGAKKGDRAVSWADEVRGGIGDKSLSVNGQTSGSASDRDNEIKGNDTSPIKSAKVCPIPLSKVESFAKRNGSISVTSQSHTIPFSGKLEEETLSATGPQSSVFPSGFSQSSIFDPEYSWYDIPPEDFCLMLSPFGTMWDMLFRWLTSSSLAFIYGKDERWQEDYLFVNGREYPQKCVSNDGRSSEIKHIVAGFLSRSLPELVSDLNLSVPISTIEKAMDQLLRTMSFVDAIPALKIRQWQVICLLFLETLSVCHLPLLALTDADRRMYLLKVLNDAKIQHEEYEVLKDLLLPLGGSISQDAASEA